MQTYDTKWRQDFERGLDEWLTDLRAVNVDELSDKCLRKLAYDLSTAIVEEYPPRAVIADPVSSPLRQWGARTQGVRSIVARLGYRIALHARTSDVAETGELVTLFLADESIPCGR